MNKDNELLCLRNVGKATLADLKLLGIASIAELRQQDPDQLYKELEQLTGLKQDPCVWDVFAAIIHEAKTGEKLPWWHFTPIRKGKNEKL